MELTVAGGCGEHGRNCFYVQAGGLCFLVDCGVMAGAPEDPYPRLTPEQIRQLDLVFLTHSHSDHCGALPWLLQQGFSGPVIAAGETLRQLPFALPRTQALERFQPPAGLQVRWGRSGHCAGSVWYRFSAGGSALLFSGDYTENALVYACDPIRDQTAELAVLDCAYGRDETPHETACERLVGRTEQLLCAHGVLLFPVPKYGRGLELLKLLSDRLRGVDWYADALFLENLSAQRTGGFWYRPAAIRASVQPYCGQTRGIVFVSDPQLRTAAARETAQQVLAHGGGAVMTGTAERGSYSAALLGQGRMEQLRYPVHLNLAQYRSLVRENRFSNAMAYHSEAFPAPRRVHT